MSNPTAPHSERRPVAYLNEKFLNSPDARAMRILSEFLEPMAHFRRERVRDTVVFSILGSEWPGVKSNLLHKLEQGDRPHGQ